MAAVKRKMGSKRLGTPGLYEPTAPLSLPSALYDIRDLHAGASFPGQALSDSKTALVLFAAAWHGRQDAYWIAEAGLRATCVDLDEGRLREMMELYPRDWEFLHGDVYDTSQWSDMSWDVVTLDPFTNQFDRCAEMLSTWCALANNVVILGMDNRDLNVPDGWQIIDRRKRSDFHGGVYWVVLEPTGVGINPDKVSACLVTRGDQPEQLARIIETLPYEGLVIWNNSDRYDLRTAGRYQAMMEAAHDVVYFQDDDTLFTHHAELMAAYEPGRITAVYGHGNNHGGYNDLPLVCGGALADRRAIEAALVRFKRPGLAEWTEEELAYADFAVGVLTPFKHVHLPFEINYEIAQHPSRLCNQPWAADAKRRVTERARAIRDGV